MIPTRYKALILSLWFLNAEAPAALLELDGTPLPPIQASGVEVPIFSEATVRRLPPHNGNPSVRLFLTGAGIREKKILLFNANVYVATSYVAEPKRIAPKDYWEGIQANPVKAIQLTFLREVSAGKIRDALAESLEKQGISSKSPMIHQVLERIQTSMSPKSTLTLVGYSSLKGKEILEVELPNESAVFEGEALVSQFWKIWFGTPLKESDIEKSMEALKHSLLTRIPEG